MKLALNPNYQLFESKGAAFCSSRQVAETFGREHKNVIASVREAIAETGDFAADFSATNFIEVKYKDRNRFYPEFLLTKDGFTYVAMKFTGKKAARFRVAYIQRFNDMERFIKNMLTARMEFPAFTDAVMNAHEEPKFYHFSNEADMINKIVLGMSAKKFRELHGLEKGVSIRPYLSDAEAEAVLALQRADIGLLEVIPEFERRREVLTKVHARNALAA